MQRRTGIGRGSICEDESSFQKRARREDRRDRISYQIVRRSAFRLKSRVPPRTAKLLVVE